MNIKHSKYEYDKERTEWNIYFKVKSSRVWNKSDGTIRSGVVARRKEKRDTGRSEKILSNFKGM